MANQRKGVPAGWHWRDGRPRWIPSPALRKLGFKGRDLKDARGAWLAKGPSIEAAEAILAEVAARRAGVAAQPRQDRRAIGALLDAYLGVPPYGEGGEGLPMSREFAAIANKIDRRSKLSRLLDVLAGHADKPRRWPNPEAEAAYRAAVAKVRGFSIDVLEPPSFDDTPDLSEAQGPLYDVYWKLRDLVGENMAHGVLSDVSAWLTWCVQRRAIRQNWALLVDRQTPPGRIRVGTWEELRALIEAAEARGLHSIADSIILGVDLSWSQVDRLNLKWSQVSADYKVKGARQKTGRTGETPLLEGLGRPRIDAIRRRQAQLLGPNVTPTHVLVCELTGRPWRPRYYRQLFAEIRAEAAKKAPSVATLNDQDLRDTAITVGKAAGLTDSEIASRSLHSLRRIKEVLDKHYSEINQEIADAGAGKLNEYLAQKGVAL